MGGANNNALSVNVKIKQLYPLVWVDKAIACCQSEAGGGEQRTTGGWCDDHLMRKGHLWGTIPPSPCMAAEDKMKEYKVAAVTQ